MKPILLALLLAAVSIPASSQQPAYDIVIYGGMVVDGSGNPWYRADVGIKDGRIQKIGTIAPDAARKQIQAAGRVVSPGFIDLHTHSDIPLLVDGTAQSAVRQGVTLDVIGESESIAPLEGVVLNEYKADAKRQFNLDVDWTTVAGYAQRLQKQGTSINVAISVAPQQIKRAVIGYPNRPARPEEIDRMKKLVEQAMLEGAVGLASAYNGGGYDNPEEMFEMASVARQYGGYYATHVGSEGYELMEELKKAIDVAEVTKIPVHIFHFKVRGKNLWGTLGPEIAMIEQARSRGLEITANQYPYTAMQHPWSRLFPDWAVDGPKDQIIKLLSDPVTREKIRKDPLFAQYVDEHGGFEGIVASRIRNPKNKPLEGKTVAEIAKLRGDKDPADTCFNLILEEGNYIYGIYHNMSEDDVRLVMKLPWVAIASDGAALRPEGVLGDGLPHPRSYGTNPRVLGEYVRDQKILSLEDAVRKMTGLPAQIMRLKDRGVLREGAWADVVVFDPKTVQDVGTFEKPKQYPRGIDQVIVNGVVVVENGTHTGAKPGKVVFGPAYSGKP
jgi:dihydroorotase/N-acyl-D-amino-acid deacylase